MDIFDIKRKDILDFDRYMDLKQPGFGGPASAEAYKDDKGVRVNKEPKLAKYQNTMERHELWSHPHYDSTYKAATNDIVYRQEGKKSTNYADPYHTAIPVKIIAEGALESFDDFMLVTEQYSKDNQVISVRNIALAEDELDKAKIDWDGFADAPSGINGRSFTKDGQVVAYYDEDAKDLFITPEAGTMSDEDHASMYGDDWPEPSEEGPADDYNTDYEEGGPDLEAESDLLSVSALDDIESELESYEEGGYGDEEEGDDEGPNEDEEGREVPLTSEE